MTNAAEYISRDCLCGTVEDVTRAHQIRERKKSEAALSFLFAIPNASFWVRTNQLRGRKFTKAAQLESKLLRALADGKKIRSEGVTSFSIAKLRDGK